MMYVLYSGNIFMYFSECKVAKRQVFFSVTQIIFIFFAKSKYIVKVETQQTATSYTCQGGDKCQKTQIAYIDLLGKLLHMVVTS